MDLTRLENVFVAFNAHHVEYAVFGAVALGLHGLARTTQDLDVFVSANPDNISRLKAALHSVFEDPSIDEISAGDLAGDYPAVRYIPPEGFGFDIVTRLGTAFRFEDLETVNLDLEGIPVQVVSARQLWLLKRDTLRPLDRADAAALAQRFGFRWDEKERS